MAYCHRHSFRFMLLAMKNKSAKKMLQKRGPIIDPSVTPKTISLHVLYELFILVVCFLFNK